MFDGLVAFAMDRWRHDCGVRRMLDSCKDLLPAPGNRSNETRYREKDLATTEERRGNEETKESGKKKTWSDKEDTAGRCIVIL
ncbi:hypothetical protein TNCV_1827051 [Trichonephila clavipes]|nr:hypothetical protein TNCV_1827051 [Trichonephila clavipes]